jgi:hypothetical protein
VLLNLVSWQLLTCLGGVGEQDPARALAAIADEAQPPAPGAQVRLSKPGDCGSADSSINGSYTDSHTAGSRWSLLGGRSGSLVDEDYGAGDFGIHHRLGAVLPVDVVAFSAGLDRVGQAEQACQCLALPDGRALSPGVLV